MRLVTDRLLLKPYKHEFADVIYLVVSQAEIADTMITIPHPYPKEVVYKWIDYLHRSAKEGTAFEFAIFLKEYPDKYIGNCGLVSISNSHQKAEIAYFIDKNEWGKGYATEVAYSMISYGFEKLGLERIYGHCMSRNPASRKVMEKVGFQFEGTLRHDVKKGEVFEDLDLLGMIRTDYNKLNSAIIK
ncbi:GNAT family N-acetyltransferase [Sporosarcina ureilytica]|uniref:GNAT family N-acetyltransferase n=1 Tax=Sporosarcina ureilytica TaxID=298596 RepID=A0A1D8JG95_9BACL|nr:GNAT family N-acetyltransferase [Sporosarcina ureilytica]AOV07742.1 GNAT family N-acetyltransferase [Sporosarcina ureilytica]